MMVARLLIFKLLANFSDASPLRQSNSHCSEMYREVLQDMRTTMADMIGQLHCQNIAATLAMNDTLLLNAFYARRSAAMQHS